MNKPYQKYFKERRKNPEMNPHIGAWDYLEQYKKDSNIYISFTEIDKLGINPQSHFNTPVGVYTYPIKEFIKYHIKKIDVDVKYKKSIGKFAPFAGTSKYINFIRLKDKKSFISNMGKKYTKEMGMKDIRLLRKKYKESLDFKDILKEARVYSDGKKPIALMWNVTKIIARELSSSDKQSSTKWNLILSKDLGYSGFADKGDGLIYPTEPT